MSGAGGAAHVDAGAVAAGDLRIDPAQHQDPAVEGDDFAVLLQALLMISITNAGMRPPQGEC